MQASAEEYFGKKAGVVWRALRENKPLSIAELKRRTRLRENDVYVGLAWLACERKIRIIGVRPMHFKFALVG